MNIFDLTNAKSIEIDGANISHLYINNILIWRASMISTQSAIAGIAIAGLAIAGME